MTVKVPFFNYPALFNAQEKEIMDTLHDVMSRGAYILQEDLEEFEENIKELIGVKHVLGVADGTNALCFGSGGWHKCLDIITSRCRCETWG
jgi:dTDP-4-amino-4,6-dideoxygalactose transaminase